MTIIQQPVFECNNCGCRLTGDPLEWVRVPDSHFCNPECLNAWAERVPGPPTPPRVPGHMGYPRIKVIDAARTVFGALTILEEAGMDVSELRTAALRQLENAGLREADLRASETHNASHRVRTSTSGLSSYCLDCDWAYEYD